jgi:predicted PurR-regulated permease PerM
MPDRATIDFLIGRILLIGAVLWLLARNIDFVALALIAVILAAAMLPLADAGEKRRVPRAVTVIAVYVVGIGLVAMLIALLVPLITRQGQEMIARLPAARVKALEWIAVIRPAAGRWEWFDSIALPEIRLEQLAPVAQEVMRRSVWVTRGFFSGTASLVMLLFLTGYLVVDHRRIRRGLLALVAPGRRDEVARIGAAVFGRMGGYIRGQALVSMAIAALLSAGLAIIRFEAPLVIGVTAGLLNLVPYLGSIVALLLAILIAANQSLLMVIGVLIVFAITQFLEGSFLTPHFLGRNVDLHPLVVFAALILGANVGGLTGMVLGVPIAAGLNTLVQKVYLEPRASRSSG